MIENRILVSVHAAGLLFALLALHGQPAAAATAKEDYELQERCGKRAEEVFNHFYKNVNGIVNNDDGSAALVAYENHYNAKLNKCFFKSTYTDLPHKFKDHNKSGSVLIDLYDINENKEYGTYFKRDQDKVPSMCKVSGKTCGSEKEWESLISTFMNE